MTSVLGIVREGQRITALGVTLDVEAVHRYGGSETSGVEISGREVINGYAASIEGNADTKVIIERMA